MHPQQKFSKLGQPDKTSVFRGGLLREKDFFLEGGCNFWIKNKLKSEIFNDKKGLQTGMLCSVITKNSNWEILTKNVIAFKR